MILPIHIAAGGLALVLGALALLARKGGTAHRRSGRLFVGAMLVMGITAAILGNVVGGLMAVYFVATALTTVRPSSPWTGRINVAALTFAVGLALLALTGGFKNVNSSLLTPNGVPYRTIGVMSFILATVLLLAAMGDLRIMRVGPLRGGPRLARHLWRMCFALFIAAGSFFSIRERVAKILPEPFTTGPMRALPILLLFGAMFYWLWRVRGRRPLPVLAIAALMMTLAVVRAEVSAEYVDSGRRFRFSYPAEFGAPSPGTNDGFQDRVAAIRFAVFSSGIGGEAALTRGFPVVDIQAAGGLYDAIALEIFPESMRRLIVQALTPLSVTNFCQQIAQEQHLDPQAVALAGLTAQQKLVIASTDRMRNVRPQVLRCVVDGTTVTFDKEVASQPGGPRQHVYGAIRFLEGPYATFQIVRAGSAPGLDVLSQMAALVKSWSRL